MLRGGNATASEIAQGNTINSPKEDNSMSQSGDLETGIMNRLQFNKRGQTIEELSKHLKKPQSMIRTVLEALRKENFVAVEDGVWIMVRQ